MAKLKPVAIDQSTLQQYVASDDDFGFEVKILHDLKNLPHVQVAHAGTDSYPVTNNLVTRSGLKDLLRRFLPPP
jgi:hypothetical protein